MEKNIIEKESFAIATTIQSDVLAEFRKRMIDKKTTLGAWLEGKINEEVVTTQTNTQG